MRKVCPEVAVPQTWNAKSRAVPDARSEKKKLEQQLKQMSERMWKKVGEKYERGEEMERMELKVWLSLITQIYQAALPFL